MSSSILVVNCSQCQEPHEYFVFSKRQKYCKVCRSSIGKTTGGKYSIN